MAAWRVALYAVFLRRIAGLSVVGVIVGTLLPLAIIVVSLTILNLEHVVFDIMGGLTKRSGNDGAFVAVFWLSLLSIMLAPLLAIAYLVLVFLSWRDARKAASASI